jgi:hypothetical protein
VTTVTDFPASISAPASATIASSPASGARTMHAIHRGIRDVARLTLDDRDDLGKPQAARQAQPRGVHAVGAERLEAVEQTRRRPGTVAPPAVGTEPTTFAASTTIAGFTVSRARSNGQAAANRVSGRDSTPSRGTHASSRLSGSLMTGSNGVSTSATSVE